MALATKVWADSRGFKACRLLRLAEGWICIIMCLARCLPESRESFEGDRVGVRKEILLEYREGLKWAQHAIEIGEKRQKWQVKLAMVLGFNLCTCARAEYGRCADYRVLKRMRSRTCLQKVKVEVCCAKVNNVNCRMNVAEHCNGAIYISARHCMADSCQCR